MESRVRTLVKSLTWRVTALGITTAIAWIITGRGELAASIGMADTLIKLVAYYSHERAWLRVGFGRLKAPDYQI